MCQYVFVNKAAVAQCRVQSVVVTNKVGACSFEFILLIDTENDSVAQSMTLRAKDRVKDNETISIKRDKQMK